MSISSFRQNLFAAVGTAVLAVGASGSALASGCGFLPVTFVECPSNLKPSQAAFCGIWGEAKWGGVIPHCLVVENVAPDGSAKIVYAWGAVPKWNMHDPGYSRYDARIERDVLKTSFNTYRGWVELEYRFVDGTLRGKYNRRGKDTLITLRRFGE